MSYPRLPSPAEAQVWLDFDGTVSQQDILDSLIERFAINRSWQLVEERWQAGLIGSRECLQQELAVIRVGKEQLAAFLDRITLDPGISELLEVLRNHGVPVTILSDGIDHFIHRTLRRHGIDDLPVRANSVSHKGRTLRLQCPHASNTCDSGAAHCKCASAAELGQPAKKSIYIGDGRSDLCPARKCSTVFAKGALARTLAQQHVPFTAYNSLHDVAETLVAAWGQKAAAV